MYISRAVELCSNDLNRGLSVNFGVSIECLTPAREDEDIKDAWKSVCNEEEANNCGKRAAKRWERLSAQCRVG